MSENDVLNELCKRDVSRSVTTLEFLTLYIKISQKDVMSNFRYLRDFAFNYWKQKSCALLYNHEVAWCNS